MATKPRTSFRSMFGLLLGQGNYGQLASKADGVNVRDMTDKIGHAAITIGAEASDARAITVQLYDHLGKAIDYAAMFEIILFSSSAMTDFVATGGTTGIAAGASGKLQAIVAKKLFRAISTTAGLWAGTYTDTGTDAGYLAVRLPNGRIVAGGLITNA